MRKSEKILVFSRNKEISYLQGMPKAYASLKNVHIAQRSTKFAVFEVLNSGRLLVRYFFS